MGNRQSQIVMVPDRQVMINVIDHIINLEAKIKKGENLTNVEEKEKKELQKVVNVMNKVQQSSVNRLGNITNATRIIDVDSYGHRSIPESSEA